MDQQHPSTAVLGFNPRCGTIRCMPELHCLLTTGTAYCSAGFQDQHVAHGSPLSFCCFVIQVKDHNANSSKAGQLVGSKAQAVKNILNVLPAPVKTCIIKYTQEVGFEATPWSDDCLGSKKWLPGFAPLVLKWPTSFGEFSFKETLFVP